MSTPEFIAMSEAWDNFLWAYDCVGWEFANVYKRDYQRALRAWVESELQ